MARATVRIVKQNRLSKPLVVYTLRDADGRIIRTDNTCGQWDEFMRQAEREVGALNVIDAMGHRTKHTWSELVDRAKI